MVHLDVYEAVAQDLEPRAFSNAPVGLNFVLTSYAFSTGNVFLDVALPLEDVTADMNQVVGAYVRTIDFFGMSSKLAIVVPFAWATWEGTLADTFATTSRTGLGDPRAQLAVSIIGAPAITPREFREYRERTIVGASLQVIMPLGQYDPERLINLGSNRWSFKPRIGVSQTYGKWTGELFATAWLFTNNSDALGATLSQDPIWAIQAHIVYAFRRSLWLSVDAGYGIGGQTSVDGGEESGGQKNTRLGATLAIPVASRHAIKLAYITGISTRIGADFDTVLLAYQYRCCGL